MRSQVTSSAVSSSAFDGDGLTINGIEVGVSAQTSAAGVTAASAAAKQPLLMPSTKPVLLRQLIQLLAAHLGGVGLSNGELVINGISVGSVASSTSAILRVVTRVTLLMPLVLKQALLQLPIQALVL